MPILDYRNPRPKTHPPPPERPDALIIVRVAVGISLVPWLLLSLLKLGALQDIGEAAASWLIIVFVVASGTVGLLLFVWLVIGALSGWLGWRLAVLALASTFLCWFVVAMTCLPHSI